MMLPIAETFHSIQGEGHHVGTPMHFIRLAGCPVGKKATDEFDNQQEVTAYPLVVLENGLPGSKCQTYDGRFFDCDTDFSCHTYKSAQELVGETWEKHICLTGGEPLIHQRNLVSSGFFAEAFAKRIQIHVETSGTVQLVEPLYHDTRIWVACAPKAGFLPEMIVRADEVKLLVDEHFDPSKLPLGVYNHPRVFLSPINEEKTVNQENVARALGFLRDFPHWRLSAQWHKYLGLR